MSISSFYNMHVSNHDSAALIISIVSLIHEKI